MSVYYPFFASVDVETARSVEMLAELRIVSLHVSERNCYYTFVEDYARLPNQNYSDSALLKSRQSWRKRIEKENKNTFVCCPWNNLTPKERTEIETVIQNNTTNNPFYQQIEERLNITNQDYSDGFEILGRPRLELPATEIPTLTYRIRFLNTKRSNKFLINELNRQFQHKYAAGDVNQVVGKITIIS